MQLFAYIEEGSLAALAGEAAKDPNYVLRANPPDDWDMQAKGLATVARVPRQRQCDDALPEFGTDPERSV